MSIINATSEKDFIEGDKITLVDFFGTWCPPCKALNPVLEEFAEENNDIKVVKVDVDKNNDLALKYNISGIPALLVFKDGKVINRAQGLVSKEHLQKLVKEVE